MKLCIPALTNNGAEAPVSNHFGSAPYFVLYNPETSTYESIGNSSADHEHGQCRPMELLAGRDIGAMICKGMGRNAVAAVERVGIKVFATQGETVQDAISDFSAGRLVKLDMEASCAGHDCHT